MDIMSTLGLSYTTNSFTSFYENNFIINTKKQDTPYISGIQENLAEHEAKEQINRKIKITAGKSFIQTRCYYNFTQQGFPSNTSHNSNALETDNISNEDQYLTACNDIQRVSQNNINKITAELGGIDNFSEIEQQILKNIESLPRARFQHQTQIPSYKNTMRSGTINLLSIDAIKQQQITHKKFFSCTSSDDFRLIGNTDYIFFTVDFSGVSLNENPKHYNVFGHFYGEYIYLIDEEHSKYGYLTLTDQKIRRVELKSNLSSTICELMNKYNLDINFLIDTAYRRIRDENNSAPIFSSEDMRSAIALYLIKFLRDTENTTDNSDEINKLRKFFAREHFYEEISYVLKVIFDFEYHIPHQLTLTNNQYSKFKINKHTRDPKKDTLLLNNPFSTGWQEKISRKVKNLYKSFQIKMQDD